MYKRLSIINKLSVLYTVSVTILLIIMAVLSGYVVNRVVAAAEDQFLIDEIIVMSELLAQHKGNLGILKTEVNAVPQSLKYATYKYYVKIIDKNNVTVMKTPDFDKIVINPLFPELDIKRWQEHSIQWKTEKGSQYRSKTAPLLIDLNGNVKYIVKIVIDGTIPRNIIFKYQYYGVTFFICCLFVLIIVGRIITKYSLKSLDEMIALTEKVSIEKLSNRIVIDNYPIELKSLGQSLNEMLARIEVAYQQISECVNVLAHELRTPIHNLMLATDLELCRDRSILDYKHLMSSHLEEFHRLNKLIDSVLFLARTNDQKMTLNWDTINIYSTVENVIRSLNMLSNQKKINIDNQTKGALIADEMLLNRALRNLLENAIKYIPNGGNVIVSVKQENAKIKLIIADNGPGIKLDILHKVINQQPLTPCQHSQVYGIGIGLRIVNTIMFLHGGTMTVQSQNQVGTSVILTFEDNNNQCIFS